MIVLSEASDQLEPSATATEIKAITEVAKLLGCRVYYIPSDFERCGTAENALYHCPQFHKATAGIWVGYVPEIDRYDAIYKAAIAKGIKLLNTTEQHQIAMEFDRFYPFLQGLTPESVVITSIEECAAAADVLGFPVFVKGAVQSRKKQGWKSCTANTYQELVQIVQGLLKLKYGSRGRVIVRKLVNLRHRRKSQQGVPLGREFRCFIYNRKILEYGYYWQGQDELSKLSPAEEKEVLNLAVAASERLDVPYISVDIGQIESGDWIVIEVGDAQFAGLSQISALKLWNKLKDLTI